MAVLDLIGVALALAVTIAGAIAALAAGNGVKRLAGAVTALVGVAATLAWLGAAPVGVLAAVALAFAYGVAGVAMLVRLQEGYGGVEIAEIDGADARDEAQEPRT